MRKSIVRCLFVFSIALLAVALVACGGSSESSETPTEQADAQASFTPSLDTGIKCTLTVAGSYDNFEALEAEFDKFNEYYPDVELSYTKIDDYNNLESWYRRVCERTASEPYWGVFEGMGVVSESGYGDGCYDIYSLRNDSGYIVSLRLKFI